ncbi:uncharacterized protein Dwil_GK23187 [Drosophila willistoni]|uniref:Uncharacterized protein n=1 Tax=Drosophila willistoni TaxID=7260 RepID=B4NMP8_DROWI|nr:uncharacterized protein LOC6652358 [Drosophila willistoni]EDW85637.1 uncharacterized protein Dwil_GK23187 [Drosophila willistoni]
MFRVQKLLVFEFEAIYEPVLVEGPIVLVDAQGNGLRQYHMALTSQNVVFSCDNFFKNSTRRGDSDEPSWEGRGQDPEIECLELVSLVPLECLRFNFYRRGDRCLMMLSAHQAHQHLNVKAPMIFEFGGHNFKHHFWYTWRERVASIRVVQPRYNEITGSSPFSSSDVQLEDELTVEVQVHPRPTRSPSGLFTRCYNSSGEGF